MADRFSMTEMKKTTCPPSQKAALLAFMRDFTGCQVRDQVFARNNPIPSKRFEGCYQFDLLRTKKNNHLAQVLDELGNTFVLTAKGQRLNLFAGE